MAVKSTGVAAMLRSAWVALLRPHWHGNRAQENHSSSSTLPVSSAAKGEAQVDEEQPVPGSSSCDEEPVASPFAGCRIDEAAGTPDAAGQPDDEACRPASRATKRSMPAGPLCRRLESLGGDIYATAVRGLLLEGNMSCSRSFRMVGALFCCIALQMALLALIWQAATKGDLPIERPEADRLWLEMGHTHRELCRLNSRCPAVSNDAENRTDQQCLERLWPAGFSGVPKTLSVTLATRCLSFKDATAMLNDRNCRRLLAYAPTDLIEYGWGMFSVDRANSSNATMDIPWEFVADLNQNFAAGTIAERDPTLYVMLGFLALAIVVHNEVLHALDLCYAVMGCKGMLPSLWDAPHSENSGAQRWRLVGGRAWCVCLCSAAVIALLQLATALAVLATGGMLYLFKEIQLSRALIIVNSVALGFIVELDNTVGEIVGRNVVQGLERQTSLTSQAASCRPRKTLGTPSLKVQKQPSHRSGALHPMWTTLYFCVVGLLVLAEALLLTPQAAAHILAFFALARLPHPPMYKKDHGVTELFMFNSDLQASNWFSNNVTWTYFAAGGFKWVSQLEPGIIPLSYSESLAVCAVYLILVVVMLLLLFQDMMPAVSWRWQKALLAAQVVLVVLCTLQYNLCELDTKVPCGWGFAVVLCFYVVLWLLLFVVWPLYIFPVIESPGA